MSLLCQVDPLLGNDRERSRYTTVITDTATKERYFLCGPCRDVISRTITGGQLVTVDGWSNESFVRQPPACKNVSTEAEDIVGKQSPGND
jgi:hypothetical protein